MALVNVNETFERRKSSKKDGKLTHTRTFRVVYDDPIGADVLAMEADDGTIRIPAEGEGYPGNPFVTCRSVDADAVSGSACVFDVTCEYESGGEIAESAVNPLDRPPRVSFTWAEATVPYFIDHSDPPRYVVTSAGEPLPEQLEREEHMLVITAVRNEASFNPVEAWAFGNTCNAGDVVIKGVTYPAGVLKLSPPIGAEAFETINVGGTDEVVHYFEVTYVLKANPLGWRDRVYDRGRFEYLPDPDPTKPGQTLPIMDAAGQVKQPWPLDGNGRAKPKPTDPPAQLVFTPYKEKDWTPLLFNP